MMKTIQVLRGRLMPTTLALAIIGLVAMSPSTSAQEKGASLLMRLNQPKAGRSAQPTQPVSESKSCPKCQNVLVQVPDRGAKGGQILLADGAPTKTVARHLCAGCDTTIKTVGYGKFAKREVTHTCAFSSAENKSCCSTAKESKAASGT